MIEMKNIYKSYFEKQKNGCFSFFKMKKTEKKVIKNLSLKIPEGKIIGLLGINGAGKTTTIRMLASILLPTSGKILIDGIDLENDLVGNKKKINLISGGERNLYQRLTAVENLEYFGSLYGLAKKELKLKINSILDIVNLTKAANTPVEKYSKGMKQRLQIAKGLINDPKYIFLDEPTLGLDILIAQELRDYVRKLATEHNKGILLTSHYIHEIEELCDYVYLLDHGSILACGTPQEILEKFPTVTKTQISFDQFSPELFAEINKLDKIIAINHNEENKLNVTIVSQAAIITEIIKIMVEFPEININEIKTDEPSLEDALVNAWNNEKTQENDRKRI